MSRCGDGLGDVAWELVGRFMLAVAFGRRAHRVVATEDDVVGRSRCGVSSKRRTTSLFAATRLVGVLREHEATQIDRASCSTSVKLSVGGRRRAV
jgi:hypothetical protein